MRHNAAVERDNSDSVMSVDVVSRDDATGLPHTLRLARFGRAQSAARLERDAILLPKSTRCCRFTNCSIPSTVTSEVCVHGVSLIEETFQRLQRTSARSRISTTSAPGRLSMASMRQLAAQMCLDAAATELSVTGLRVAREKAGKPRNDSSSIKMPRRRIYATIYPIHSHSPSPPHFFFLADMLTFFFFLAA